MRYKIHVVPCDYFSDSDTGLALRTQIEKCQRWVKTLTPSQVQELGRLDASRLEPGVVYNEAQAITSDWIEEYGGDRDWWGLIRAVEVG